MAIMITDDCLNCDACAAECPNNAIYKGGEMWTFAEGTALTGNYSFYNGTEVDAFAEQEPNSNDFFYIVPEKCTECKGFHDEPQCAAVCPVDCCIPDPSHVETNEALEAKRARLHD